MGNCQATEAAAVLIQHPGGKVDRLYWPTTASEVMKSNPGHFVALVTLYVSEEKPGGGGTTRFTRVRLLKSEEALSLGNVYRLITSQEVAKAIRARKQEKMKKNQAELFRRQQPQRQGSGTGHDKGAQMVEDGREHNDSDTMDQDMIQLIRQQRQRSSSGQSSAARSRQWRPTLQSITEAGT